MRRIDRLRQADEWTADRIATLQAVKRGLAGMSQDVVVVPVRERGVRPLWALGLSIAAVIVAVAIGAAIFRQAPAGQQLPGVVADAFRQHDDMATGGYAASSAVAGFSAPDLDAAGLKLVAIADDRTIAGEKAFGASYVGIHGCRLSLFEYAGVDADQAFRTNSRQGLHWASWAVDMNNYIVVARKMDDVRFTLLAGSIHAMTEHDESKPAPDLVAQLEGARQPCSG